MDPNYVSTGQGLVYLAETAIAVLTIFGGATMCASHYFKTYSSSENEAVEEPSLSKLELTLRHILLGDDEPQKPELL